MDTVQQEAKVMQEIFVLCLAGNNLKLIQEHLCKQGALFFWESSMESRCTSNIRIVQLLIGHFEKLLLVSSILIILVIYIRQENNFKQLRREYGYQ